MAQQDSRSDRPDAAGRFSIDSLYLIVMRTEAKIDTMMSTQTLRDEAVNSELKNIRDGFNQRLETHHASIFDHEQRTRALEARRYVDPKTVWTATGILTSLGMLVIAIINQLTR